MCGPVTSPDQRAERVILSQRELNCLGYRFVLVDVLAEDKVIGVFRVRMVNGRAEWLERGMRR